MADRQDLAALRARIHDFATARGWHERRTLKDLSLAIGIEAAELQELFLWENAESDDELVARKRDEIEDELADVFIYCLAFSDRVGADLLAIAEAKMGRNEQRFPATDREAEQRD